MQATILSAVLGLLFMFNLMLIIYLSYFMFKIKKLTFDKYSRLNSVKNKVTTMLFTDIILLSYDLFIIYILYFDFNLPIFILSAFLSVSVFYNIKIIRVVLEEVLNWE